MIKENRKLLTLTSLVMLLPAAIGLLLWKQLPQQIPFHWDINGNIDNWASKPVAVFAMPALMLALQWLCVLVSGADPKHKNYSPKMITLMLWICPAIELVLTTLIYTAALGHSPKVEIILPLLMGAMFLVIGNLLPKCRQSYTMGVKLPWTLASEENWNKTHRFAGKVWVGGSVVIMATAFLGSFWLLLGMMIVMTAAPTLYSYLYYRKYEKNR